MRIPPVRGKFSPAIKSSDCKPCDHNQQHNPNDPLPARFRHCRCANDRGRRRRAIARSQHVLREQAFFVQSKMMRHGAHKSAIKNSAGQLIPLLIFHGIQKTRTDARGRANFVQGNAAHFAFAAQMFAKSSFCGGLIHSVELCDAGFRGNVRTKSANQYRRRSKGCQSARVVQAPVFRVVTLVPRADCMSRITMLEKYVGPFRASLWSVLRFAACCVVKWTPRFWWRA
jgi:hypothetical protein